MNEFDYNLLREKGWRHKLTAAEKASVQAWLAQHPESKADWELESHLSDALANLPEAPVPSNFTARVLQAVECEKSVTARPAQSRTTWFLRSLLPKAAVAAVMLSAGLLYHEHTTAKRAELVQGVKIAAEVPSLLSPQILQDFDTIRRISPGPDQELIALMK